MELPSYKEIKIEKIQNGILMVYLYRPKDLNTFTDLMANELIDIFHRADRDDSVRVVIVTGHGDVFCAGAALKDIDKLSSLELSKLSASERRDEGGMVTQSIHHCRKPVIAAINGTAVGVGITMTLAMSIRIVAEDAKIGFVFNRRGLCMEACSSYFLPKIVGFSKSHEWVLTGRVFTAKDEANSGLFNYILPKSKVLEKAIEIATEISTKTPAVSTAVNKALLDHSVDEPQKATLIESKAFSWLFSSKDGKEGIQSFLEKRSPSFKLKVSQDMPDFFPWWYQTNVVPYSKL
eukprot:TRINITY_DN1425_c0_g1_i2.p1 TRINITY_DN1425_c0_g1~~TRINITY_DN1425_c0_g1_i2.p1  ORF type:complete len:292 (-),score=72.61 TRINITY_DN1425_c0_g1_i2:12-887(-)